MAILRGYSLPVGIVQTTTPAAATVVWAMRNLNGITIGTVAKPVFLRALMLNTTFSGVAAATVGIYNLVRIRAATPSGGAALVPVKRLMANPTASLVNAQQLDTGLTVAGVTIDTTPIMSMCCPRQNGASTQFPDNWQDPADETIDGFEVPSGDGIAIVLGATAVAGDSITGYLSFDEMPTRQNF